MSGDFRENLQRALAAAINRQIAMGCKVLVQRHGVRFSQELQALIRQNLASVPSWDHTPASIPLQQCATRRPRQRPNGCRLVVQLDVGVDAQGYPSLRESACLRHLLSILPADEVRDRLFKPSVR